MQPMLQIWINGKDARNMMETVDFYNYIFLFFPYESKYKILQIKLNLEKINLQSHETRPNLQEQQN